MTGAPRHDGNLLRAADGSRLGARDPSAPLLGGRHLRTLLCTESYLASHQLERGDVALVVPDERNLLWLDLEAPTTDDLNALAEEFGFHPLAIEDASTEHQRAKIDHYDTFSFVVLFGVTYNELTHQIQEHELDVFVGANCLITVHYWPLHDIDRVAARLATDIPAAPRGVGVLLYSLCDTVVDSYLPVADRIRDRIRTLERRVFARRPIAHVLESVHEDVFILRSELLDLRQVIGPERGVLAVLSHRGVAVIDKHAAVYFKDVADHLQRVVETIDVYHDMLSSVLDSYHAQSANA